MAYLSRAAMARHSSSTSHQSGPYVAIMGNLDPCGGRATSSQKSCVDGIHFAYGATDSVYKRDVANHYSW